MTTKRTTAAAATDDSVVADDGVKFICDVRNVEDLLLVPNSKWVIGSRVQLGTRVAKLSTSVQRRE